MSHLNSVRLYVNSSQAVCKFTKNVYNYFAPMFQLLARVSVSCLEGNAWLCRDVDIVCCVDSVEIQIKI